MLFLNGPSSACKNYLQTGAGSGVRSLPALEQFEESLEMLCMRLGPETRGTSRAFSPGVADADVVERLPKSKS